ncbi:MAG TPA: polysaccharide deacetylase family protein [Ktedonobacteraceae bacterium]|nr:polysaccharide deacetylase family protein [Ktedonobacteraceae bacterium]
MRRRILIAIAACFYYSSLVALARWLTARAGPRVVVLIYHYATGGDLRNHLLYLRRHYRLMHMEAALEELYTQRKDGRRTTDRRTPLVVTFDDGYRDNYTYAFELAKELQIPFTIYLIPGYIESGDHFWWLEGKRLVKRAQVQDAIVDGRTYHLNVPEEREALSRLIDARARHAPSVAEREEFLASIRELLAVPSIVHEEELPVMPVTWEQVREMDESGWVSFGAHTMHHPILSNITNPAEVQSEVIECRRVLAQKLGHPVRSLAYPVGQMQHIGEHVIQAVKQAGYEWAVTTNYGSNTPQSERLLLNRIEADVDQHWLVVAAEAAGLWGFFARLRWLPFIRKHFTNASYQVVQNQGGS